MEEGGSYFLLRIYERNKDSLRSIFMGKESAKRLLTYVEDLLSLSPPDQFARTFREGNKVFILQLGFNVHGRFLMISELEHGRRKGLIIVLEGKLGSGWRGFGFHLRKAISPDPCVVKSHPSSILIPDDQSFSLQKSFLSAAMDGDRSKKDGNRKGKPLLANVQNSNKAIHTIKSSLGCQNLELREKGVGQVSSAPEADFTLDVKDNPLNGAKSPLSLEISLKLERGLNGKWEFEHSSVKEVEWVCNSGIGPMQEAAVRPISADKNLPSNPPQAQVFKPKNVRVWQPKHVRVFKPKHVRVWQPKRKIVSPRPL